VIDEARVRPKIDVFLDIRGFEEPPTSITQIVGISPDETWSKGDSISGIKTLRKFSCWKIRASLTKYSYDVDDYVDDIVRKILPAAAAIKRIKNANVMLCIWITLHASGRVPSICFHPNIMRALSDIDAEIDIDISVLPD